MVSDHPEYLKTAWELGITRAVLPEFDAMMETPQNGGYHNYNVGEHTLKALEAVRPERILRMTVLLHDCGKPMVRSMDEDGRDHFTVMGM